MCINKTNIFIKIYNKLKSSYFDLLTIENVIKLLIEQIGQTIFSENIIITQSFKTKIYIKLGLKDHIYNN